MATFTGRFLILAKLATEWNAADPVLMNGELGVAEPGSSAPVLKVGDGVRPWSALPQISGSGGGAANDYVVGTTTTLAPGSFATVTIDNTVDPPTISFGIPRGNTGPANSLAIGTTTTGDPGTPASATITGTPPAQVLNLIIPQGDVGPPGEDGAPGSSGPTGADGPANNLTIGTVTTGTPGSPAEATITGTPPAQELNLVIPAGLDGAGLLLVDPSGTIGLTMVPGVATTTTRSDSSPPLSQAIAPTWTGQHLFRGGVSRGGVLSQVTLGLVSSIPLLGLTNSAAATDAKTYEAFVTNTGELVLQALNEAGSDARDIIRTARTALAVTGLNFGNTTDNPAYNFLGTGVTSVSGQIVVGAPTGGATGTGTINATGLYINGVALTAAAAANPSALVGLAAINGAAVTFMRSDAAPALNQGIAPTWTALHTFSNAIVVGAPTGGSQGAGTINAAGLFVNGVAVGTGAGAVGANPSALVGLAAINGAAVTFMRSDAAPALNQAIAPTWTGAHTWSSAGATINTLVSSSTTGFISTYLVNDTGAYFRMALAGSANAVQYTSSGPTGPAAYLYTTGANQPISIGTNGAERLRIADAGFTVRGLDLLNTAAGQDIGSAAQGWRRILTVDGSASMPTTTWSSDQDTGMYLHAVDQIGFATAGVTQLRLHSTFTYSIPPFMTESGTVALPAYTFNGDTNTGMYRFAADVLAFSTAGTFAGAITAGQQWVLPDGTAGNPVYSFNNDPNTGIYRPGADDLRIVAGGVVVGIFRLAGQVVVAEAGDAGNPSMTFLTDTNTGLYSSGADSVNVTTGGTLRLSISTTAMTSTLAVSAPSFTSTSSRAIKRETGRPRQAADILSRLRPVLYRLLDNDHQEQLGLIAEEVHEVCPQLSDGNTVSYDRLALLLLADWQESRAAA